MLKRKILLIAACAIATSSWASPDINNPMTRAVLDVYEQQLKADPTDYNVWLNRAHVYYNNSEYMRALNDVDNALKYMGTKSVDDRVMALLLRANIYTQTGRPAKALDDLNIIVGIDPNNYVAVYQRANAYYALGDYVSAKQDYQRLKRLNSRSPEAMVGLARIAVKENNLGTANEYLDQAVTNDPSNADLYVRRASVRRDMGNNRGAVEDLIVSLAVDSRNNSKAMAMLVEYSNDDYPAVIAGLTDAMQQAPNVGMYPYLRAVIAQHHYHYKAALADFQLIVDKRLYDYQGIWRSMAECRYAMGQFEQALNDVDRALDMDRNAGDAILLRARILRAMGRYNDAKSQAAVALTLMPGNIGAMNEAGLIYASLKEYQKAADMFAEATITAGDAPDAQPCYMYRAWMLGEYLNQPVAAAGFYGKVADIAFENPGNPIAGMYGAFAKACTDKLPDAKETVANILVENPASPYLQYLGTCFYAQIDDFDKALECARQALENGYANYYDWEYESDAKVNVAPLRNDLRFLNLLDRYKHLWN